MSKIGVHQSTLCYNLNHYTNKQIGQEGKVIGHIIDTANQQKRRPGTPGIYHITTTQRQDVQVPNHVKWTSPKIDFTVKVIIYRDK